jgi:hypothetical protein
VLFILMGAFIFLLPLTMTIAAFALFLLLECVGLALNPLSIVSIRDWIIRCAIGGALIQAINNAAYYRYMKSGARDPK